MTESPLTEPTKNLTENLKGRLKGFVEQRLLLGQSLTLELSAILLVYFVQGILGLARLAVSFFPERYYCAHSRRSFGADGHCRPTLDN